MAKTGHVYPQVEPGIAALMDARVVTCAPAVSVARALARARPRQHQHRGHHGDDERDPVISAKLEMHAHGIQPPQPGAQQR